MPEWFRHEEFRSRLDFETKMIERCQEDIC